MLVKNILFFLLRSYQIAAAPIFGGACRFHPSCSQYAVEAMQKHSIRKAIILIVFRLCKCRPGGSFGFDPVPERGTYGRK